MVYIGWFISDGIILCKSICFYFHMETNAFFNYLENYMIFFHFIESICFYFMWKRTHFTSRDFIQQEVLNFSENRKSYRETSLDMSGENRK